MDMYIIYKEAQNRDRWLTIARMADCGHQQALSPGIIKSKSTYFGSS